MDLWFCLCVVGHFLFVAVVIKWQLEQLHLYGVMVQNAEERKNLLDYINLTKGKIVELLDFQQ